MSNIAGDLAYWDGDGHVIEDIDGIVKMLPKPFRDRISLTQLVPPLDHHHSAIVVDVPEGAFQPVGPQGWADFMVQGGFEQAILYPTWFLAVGKYVEEPIAHVSRSKRCSSPDHCPI